MKFPSLHHHYGKDPDDHIIVSLVASVLIVPSKKDAGLMLGQRSRRWLIIKPALGQLAVVTGH